MGQGRPGARRRRPAAGEDAEPRGHRAARRCRSGRRQPRHRVRRRGRATSATRPANGRAVARDRRPRRRARHARARPRRAAQPSASSPRCRPARARPTRRSRSAGDALPIDDRRWVRASLRDQVRVLLVDGDPRTVRHDDELFYLEAALRPGDREDSGTSVRAITAEELAGIEPRAQGTAARDRARRLRRRRARERRRAAAPSASTCSPQWVRAGGGILSRPAIASIPRRTTARCCRCCRRACAIRSTPRGARRPRIATAARCTS